MIANLWGKGGRKKRILGYVLASTICLAPLSVTLMAQPTWGQQQNLQGKELNQLIQQAVEQEQQGKPTKSNLSLIVQTNPGQNRKSLVKESEQLLLKATDQTQQGNPIQAIETWRQFLSIVQQLKTRGLEAIPLLGIGINYYNMGQYQQALYYYAQSLNISKEIGDHFSEAGALSKIGQTYLASNKYRIAREKFNEVLKIYQESGNRLSESSILNEIGEIYRENGQFEEALQYYNQSLLILTGILITTNKYSSKREENIFYKILIRNKATILNNIGLSYYDLEKIEVALSFYEKALSKSREIGDISLEASIIINISSVYQDIVGQEIGFTSKIFSTSDKYKVLQGILDSNYQALQIFKATKNRYREAITLNNIGTIYQLSWQMDTALNFHKNSLAIFVQLGNFKGQSSVFNNIGNIYSKFGNSEEAMEYYNRSLNISVKIGDRASEANTLSNIAAVYRDTKRTKEAIASLERSIEISLEIRSSLKRENRQKFSQSGSLGGSAIALTDLLITENQPDKAYEWINRVATAELADYTRLVNAKVANPEAQKAIDDWNQKNAQLQFLYRQLQEKFSEERSQQMRELEKQVFKQAEEIARQFPEAAELFETKPEDIAKLRASIPPDTVVVHPVLLTGVKNVPNSIAIFVFTKDKLTVTKKPLDPKEFDQLLKDYRDQLEKERGRLADFPKFSAKLYDILIRPVEAQIQAASPKQLSIIATGKLRYLPFETLQESPNGKYLLEKYPINYLTRLSTRSLQNAETPNFPPLQNVLATGIIASLGILTWRKFGIIQSGVLVIILGGSTFFLLGGRNAQVLALGNPLPTQENLAGAEAEVNSIGKIFAGSEVYIREQATLDTFKKLAPKFSFLHLATHGCFENKGCPTLQMEKNTLLFANQQQFNIADAALLGLKNTELLTLSACQTAKEANANGEEIAGLAYIFERAGAKAVMASLWNADDNTTKDIMEQFYTNVKKGMSKGKALQQAKLKHIARHPYFWSTLVLIGDAQ